MTHPEGMTARVRGFGPALLLAALSVPAGPAAADLGEADPGLRLRAAIAACIALADDPAAPAAAARAAGWDVDVPEGSGSGIAVFRSGPLMLSVADDASMCSVHATDRPLADMEAALRDALAAAGLAAVPAGEPWNDCAPLDLGGGRRAVATAGTADFTCGAGSQGAVYLYRVAP